MMLRKFHLLFWFLSDYLILHQNALDVKQVLSGADRWQLQEMLHVHWQRIFA
jgi:hypothetical protein